MRMRSRLHLCGVGLVVGLAAACGGDAAEEPAPDAAAPTQDTGAATPSPATPAPVAANLPAGVTPEMVQQGQQIFTGNGICYTCHGQNAEGTQLAPSLTDDQWLWITPGADMYEQIVTRIQTGVPQPKEYPAPMPPLGGAALSEEQVRSVAAYVYSLSQG